MLNNVKYINVVFIINFKFVIMKIIGGIMNINFRIMKKDDLEKVINLCNLCFEENTNMDYAINMYEKTKDDENQIYVVGEIDKDIVAHLKITIIPTIYENMNTFAILNHICVKPEYRRHGFATKMLQFTEEICKDKNCVCMELWSKDFRTAAHACYKEYGFVIEAPFFSKKIS